MNEPKLRVDDNEYDINTQILVPGKKKGYYIADEVEVFKLIIG